MKRDILVAAGIDYDSGVRRFAGRASLYEKSLSRFPGEGTFQRIRADYQSGDRPQLLLDVHEFKGMCGNIAVSGLYDASEAMLSLLRAEPCAQEELDSAYTLLAAGYAKAVAAVRAAMEADV